MWCPRLPPTRVSEGSPVLSCCCPSVFLLLLSLWQLIHPFTCPPHLPFRCPFLTSLALSLAPLTPPRSLSSRIHTRRDLSMTVPSLLIASCSLSLSPSCHCHCVLSFSYYQHSLPLVIALSLFSITLSHSLTRLLSFSRTLLSLSFSGVGARGAPCSPEEGAGHS